MLVPWILSRLVGDEKGELEINFAYESFRFECVESGVDGKVPGLIIFIEHLKAIFPNVKHSRRKISGNIFKTVYTGISLKHLETHLKEDLNFSNIKNNIPDKFSITCVSSNEIHCEGRTAYLSNGHHVNKKVILHNNWTWELSIGGKAIDLKQLYIDSKFKLTTEGVSLVFKCVQLIKLCSGIQVTKSIVVSRYHTLDKWAKEGDTPVRSVRSVLCMKTIPVNAKSTSCRTCQKMTFGQSHNKENEIMSPQQKPDTSSQQSLTDDIKQIFPGANDSMIQLLLEQAKNVSKHPNGRRWSQHFIGVCLQLYNRSPHCCEMLCTSQLLVLPSKSLLIMYKNALKQNPGFDENVIEWMLMEANRQNIPDNERYGGIIFDEMAIQPDIEIDKKGDIVELCGFTDYGIEGDSFHTLRTGTREKSLGKYVLQLLFLCTSGFRFPFAHFVTSAVQASELYGLFWEAVYLLNSYGFKVLYTCMDGAQSNRSFMHICIKNNPTSFISRCPSTRYEVIFLMDISHVLKKLRNNILKSGIYLKCTRLLTLPSSYTIQWKMFQDLFHWDQQNALQIHRKLTSEHFNLDAQMKMRNHLAEEVLNSDMLHAMQIYKKSLGEKGSILNGAIELLEQTSKLIEIFRDMRPIKCTDDQRLSTLKGVRSWFHEWTSFINNNSEIPKKEKGKCLLSHQCSEDIQSCIQGFISLCSKVTQESSSMYVTPALVNSDIIENVFNQQRSTYHGANSNPNALQYKRAINSILVGQTVVSKKSNAGRSSIGRSSMPYSFTMKQPLRKRKQVPSSDSSVSKVKVIRM